MPPKRRSSAPSLQALKKEGAGHFQKHLANFDWPNVGEEWEAHLHAVLSERAGCGTFSSERSFVPEDRVRFSPQGPTFTTSLLVVPLDSGLYVRVEGDGARDGTQVGMWRDAISEAIARIGKATYPFTWSAMIGVAPGVKGIRQLRALLEPVVIGGVKLLPARRRETDRVAAWPPMLHTWQLVDSWPMHVTAQQSGYEWQVVADDAKKKLFCLCSALSVIWGECWTLRALPVPVPPPPPTSASASPPGEDASEPSAPPGPLTVPAWLPVAWPHIESDETLCTALAMHHEGLAIDEAHPSLALVAFVAAIETLGTHSTPVARCPTCKQITQSTQRFVNAVRAVLPAKEASALYNARSKTAHASVLHGGEGMFGRTFTRMLAAKPDIASAFEWGQLHAVRKASGLLLLQAIHAAAGHPHE